MDTLWGNEHMSLRNKFMDLFLLLKIFGEDVIVMPGLGWILILVIAGPDCIDRTEASFFNFLDRSFLCLTVIFFLFLELDSKEIKKISVRRWMKKHE